MRRANRRYSLLATITGLATLLALPAMSHAAEVSFLKTIEVPAVTSSGEITVSPVIDNTKGVACQNIRLATEDGNWQGRGYTLLCKSQSFTLSAGNGIKGVYMQAQGALKLPDGSFKTVESNIVFVKLRKVAETTPAPQPQPTGPTITAVQVDMPDPAKVNDPMAMPSERLPHVNFTIKGADGCTLDSFQYRLTAEGAWKDVVNRTRPFVHLDPKPGVQNLYVQLVGACNRDDDYAYGPLGNIFHTTVTVPDYNAPAPAPAAGPIVLDSIEVPATTTEHAVPITIDYHGGEGCMDVRTATEDGNWGTWITCKSVINHAASAGTGIKGVFVQVKGSDGSLSQIKFAKYQVVKGNDNANPTKPTKDETPPTISRVTISTAFPSPVATVKIATTDDIGVTMIRFANEDGNWGKWQTYKASMSQTISAGKGYKGLFTQVKDASGKHSTITFSKFTVS